MSALCYCADFDYSFAVRKIIIIFKIIKNNISECFELLIILVNKYILHRCAARAEVNNYDTKPAMSSFYENYKTSDDRVLWLKLGGAYVQLLTAKI